MHIKNVISEAVRQSKKANYIFKLGAVVFNRHRIIASGYNRVFSTGADCAEQLAIKKAPNKLLKNATILVCRTRKNGTFGMARPCDRCMSLINKSGIKKIIYSAHNGWETMNPHEA